MIIENKRIEGKSLTWILRYPTIKDRIHKDGNYYNTVIMERLLDK